MNRYTDRYADGRHISARRVQKAAILGETIAGLLPEAQGLEIVDFGCADGAVPVLMLQSPIGESIKRMTGITLLDYNDLDEKSCHTHPRFTRLIGDLDGDLGHLDLPWGRCDVVTATAFFHYLAQPATAFAHAYRLLKPGGYLLAGLPARWVLSLRYHGLPGLLPRNTRIRHIHPLTWWTFQAESSGFTVHANQTIQWLGLDWSAGIERTLRNRQWFTCFGSNHLLILRKPG